MQSGLNVCGVLVHAHPSRLDEVEAALDRLAGVETHGRGEGGRIVVTIEDTANSTAADSLAALHKTDGVIAAALVYHEFDPDPDRAPAKTETVA